MSHINKASADDRYCAPQLIEYGTLGEVTLGVGMSGMGDSGKGKDKTGF